MGGRRLRYFVKWFGLYCMDQVRKLDRVLNKKDRNVITNQIVVSFLRVEFHRETAYVARKIG